MSSGDSGLIQIVDAALAEAARKSGAWLVCRPGCMQCCIGPFEISQPDARRRLEGLAELDSPRSGAAQSGPAFPPLHQYLGLEEELLHPALDPEAGTCDLYTARPITCRTFGPPMRCGDDVIGICELCFEGATDAEVAACEVEVDPDGLEAVLIKEELERAHGRERPDERGSGSSLLKRRLPCPVACRRRNPAALPRRRIRASS